MTTANQAMRTFNQRRATQDALNNERVTRERVKHLEHVVQVLEKRQRLEDLAARSFWGRLRWLLRGE